MSNTEVNKAKIKWTSRVKFDALSTKDDNTLYFIYNEHVLYKGNQQYGGIQNVTYELDTNGNYIVTIVEGNGSQQVYQVAKSSRVEKALNDLAAHIATDATENTKGHVKLTDDIPSVNPQDITATVAVTPKAVVDYILEHPSGLKKYVSATAFPIVGSDDAIYYAKDTNMFYIYDEGNYKLMSPSWSNIKIIRGDTAINA